MILEGELDMGSLTLSEKPKCPVCKGQIDHLKVLQVSTETSLPAIFARDQPHHHQSRTRQSQIH